MTDLELDLLATGNRPYRAFNGSELNTPDLSADLEIGKILAANIDTQHTAMETREDVWGHESFDIFSTMDYGLCLPATLVEGSLAVSDNSQIVPDTDPAALEEYENIDLLQWIVEDQDIDPLAACEVAEPEQPAEVKRVSVIVPVSSPSTSFYINPVEQEAEVKVKLEPLSEDEKYRRMRTQNNDASKRCRENRKRKAKEEEDLEETDGKTLAEIKRERAIARIKDRMKKHAEARSRDNLRSPVVCVLGHVDTGKTKILDKLRRTSVQDGEAGGITQQIGATNVPIAVIKEQCKMVQGFLENPLRLPGLLIIDTPGHESFSNLRDRGSSLCDIAILVIDIMHSLEPQTIESLNLLKKKKTPFVVALNKIDRLYEWKSNRHKDIRDVLDSQPHNTKLEFQKKKDEVILGLAEQGLNAALFWENPDPADYISLVPTSAHSGDGMGNLMGQLVEISQTRLEDRLSFSEELQATVLEVKAIRLWNHN